MKSNEDKGLGIKGWISGPKPKSAKAEPTLRPVILDKHRIAVLPFGNISPDSKDEYFADGMTEELISTLSLTSGLKVIARTSVMKYKGTSKGIGEIGEELKIGTVLEGSVRKFENRLRLTVQLIDTSSEEHLWGQSFDREFKDIFAIQSEIARNVAEVLKLRLLPREGGPIERQRQKVETTTDTIDAYSLYLKGRYYYYKTTPNDLKKAIDYFERAVEKDPAYAPPYAALSRCFAGQAFRGTLPSKEAISKAKAYALKSIGIDETLAEAHASLARVLHCEWNWLEAQREVRTAIDVNPNYGPAYWVHAHILLNQLKYDEAVSQVRKELAIDPLSAQVNADVGTTLYYSHRFDEAVPYFRRAIEIDPESEAHNNLGMTLVQKGLCQEGIAEIQKFHALGRNTPLDAPDLAYALARCGKPKEAKGVLRELERVSNLEAASGHIAALFAILGEKELAFQWLEKAYQEHSVLLTELKSEFWFENIRSDPRFTALLKKVGLADEGVMREG